MKPENLAAYSNEQLVEAFKKLKTDKIINAFIIGITIGIFFFNVVKNGFGFFTFFPLLIGYLLIKNSSNSKILEKEILKEMNDRGLS